MCLCSTLNPKNFLSSGCATALFASLTVSLSLSVRNLGVSPLTQLPSQLLLDVLPQSGHEMSVLLAVPNRSGPSIIRLLFAPPLGLECLTSLADSMAYCALC